MKVVLVDDEKLAVRLFSEYTIDKRDIELAMYVNNPNFLIDDAIAGKDIDVAVLDVNMPIISGFDLADKLIQLKPDVRIVFITGYIQDEEEVKKRFSKNLFRIIYKPYIDDDIESLIEDLKQDLEKRPKIRIRTFGNFDVFVNGAPVNFVCKKGKELLAMLVDADGGYVTKTKLMHDLWEEKDTAQASKLYGDTKIKLINELKMLGVDHIIDTPRGSMGIRKENINCDLWDYLKNSTGGGGCVFDCEYMAQYDSWIEATEGKLMFIYNNFADK